jgi:Spy/CpxP family protein refolding chaperone
MGASAPHPDVNLRLGVDTGGAFRRSRPMSTLRRLSIAVPAAFALVSLLWCGVAVSDAARGAGPAALAQGTGGSPGRGARRFAEMLASIRPPLTDAQKARIRQMRDAMMKQRQSEPQPADPAARRARFMAFLDQIRGVLTPAQQRDFDAKRAAMRNRQSQGQGSH